MRAQTGSIEAQALADMLDAAWRDIGPTGDPLRPLFRTSANRILDHARGRPAATASRSEAVVPLHLGRPHDQSPGRRDRARRCKLVVRRLATGRAPSRPTSVTYTR